MPSLADGFCARPETAADLAAALVTGAVVVLVPARVAGERPGGWLESCGKTQLAVCVAESLWQARRLDLLIWVTCTKRASVMSGYLEAAAAVRETGLSGDGEPAARACPPGSLQPWADGPPPGLLVMTTNQLTGRCGGPGHVPTLRV